METYQAFRFANPLRIQGRLILKQLIDDENGLSIVLRTVDSADSICINFSYAYCYRGGNESYRLQSRAEFSKEMNLVQTVENSMFLKWFHEESLNIYIGHRMTHYLILTEEEIFDILSVDAPTLLQV